CIGSATHLHNELRALFLGYCPRQIATKAMDRDCCVFVLKDTVLEAGEVGDHEWQAPPFDVARLGRPVKYLPWANLEMGDQANIGNDADGGISRGEHAFASSREAHKVCHCA